MQRRFLLCVLFALTLLLVPCIAQTTPRVARPGEKRYDDDCEKGSGGSGYGTSIPCKKKVRSCSGICRFEHDIFISPYQEVLDEDSGSHHYALLLLLTKGQWAGGRGEGMAKGTPWWHSRATLQGAITGDIKVDVWNIEHCCDNANIWCTTWAWLSYCFEAVVDNPNGKTSFSMYAGVESAIIHAEEIGIAYDGNYSLEEVCAEFKKNFPSVAIEVSPVMSTTPRTAMVHYNKSGTKKIEHENLTGTVGICADLQVWTSLSNYAAYATCGILRTYRGYWVEVKMWCKCCGVVYRVKIKNAHN